MTKTKKISHIKKSIKLLKEVQKQREETREISPMEAKLEAALGLMVDIVKDSI